MGEDRVNDYYNAFLSVIDACIEFYVPLRRCKKVLLGSSQENCVN